MCVLTQAFKAGATHDSGLLLERPFKHKHGIINAQLLTGLLWPPRAACIDFPFKAASKSRRLLKEPREGTVTLCKNRQSDSEKEEGLSV